MKFFTLVALIASAQAINLTKSDLPADDAKLKAIVGDAEFAVIKS
tara:strand:+ start:37 stop:171 length:135 start_codon:yes stop_codon:yes gene_type:complete